MRQTHFGLYEIYFTLTFARKEVLQLKIAQRKSNGDENILQCNK